MKTIILTSIIAIISMLTAYTQQDRQTVAVDISTLNNAERQAYFTLVDAQSRQKQTNRVLQTEQVTVPSPTLIQQYAEAGKGLGMAFKECWSAISTDVERFANSSAGKWSAVLVTWKIAGRDAMELVNRLVRYIVGSSLICVSTIFFAYTFYKNCVTRRVVSARTYNPERKRYDIEYTTHTPPHAQDG